MAFSIDNLLKRPVADSNGSASQTESAPPTYPYHPWSLSQQPNGHVAPNPTIISAKMTGTLPQATMFSLDPTPPLAHRNSMVMPTLADLQLLFGGGGKVLVFG